jgi:hypothetical protein
VETIALCGHSPALVEAINRREGELRDIAQRLLSAEPGSVSAQVADIRRFVSERLGNIRQLLNADVQRAKVELAKHVSRIEMRPQTEGKKGHYIAVGEWNLLGGSRGLALPKPPKSAFGWLRGVDLNHRPLGYEPNELPDCSTPQSHRNVRSYRGQIGAQSAVRTGATKGHPYSSKVLRGRW